MARPTAPSPQTGPALSPPQTLGAPSSFPPPAAAVPRPGRVMMQPSVVAAVERARMELGGVREGGGPGVILVTGSMHAAGAALRRLHLVPA